MKNTPYCYILFALISLVTFASFSGCDQSDDVSVAPPVINPAQDNLTFQVSGGWPDVHFTHKSHAEEYLEDECLTCHSHTGIRDVTIWNCSDVSCHSSDDTEGLCADDAEGHACWMKQCEACHATLSPDPTPNCTDCHA